MNPQNHIGKLILLLGLVLPLAYQAQTKEPAGDQAPPTATPQSPPLPKWKLELMAKLERIIFPEIEFKDAPLEDVIKFLIEKSREIDRKNGGVSGVNIVIIGVPPDYLKKGAVTITLSLRNVSLRDTLRYVTDIAGLKFIIDSNKIIFMPPDYGKSPQPI